MSTQARPLSFADQAFQNQKKKTKWQETFEKMEAVVPWDRFVAIIEPYYHRSGGRGRQPYPLETMLRIHLMQMWAGYSDPQMEDALYENQTFLSFSGLSRGIDNIPDETTILNFRHLLERHNLSKAIFDEVKAILAAKGLLLKEGSVVDATIIHAPTSTKNSSGSP